MYVLVIVIAIFLTHLLMGLFVARSLGVAPGNLSDWLTGLYARPVNRDLTCELFPTRAIAPRLRWVWREKVAAALEQASGADGVSASSPETQASQSSETQASQSPETLGPPSLVQGLRRGLMLADAASCLLDEQRFECSEDNAAEPAYDWQSRVEDRLHWQAVLERCGLEMAERCENSEADGAWDTIAKPWEKFITCWKKHQAGVGANLEVRAARLASQASGGLESDTRINPKGKTKPRSKSKAAKSRNDAIESRRKAWIDQQQIVLEQQTQDSVRHLSDSLAALRQAIEVAITERMGEGEVPPQTVMPWTMCPELGVGLVLPSQRVAASEAQLQASFLLAVRLVLPANFLLRYGLLAQAACEQMFAGQLSKCCDFGEDSGYVTGEWFSLGKCVFSTWVSHESPDADATAPAIDGSRVAKFIQPIRNVAFAGGDFSFSPQVQAILIRHLPANSLSETVQSSVRCLHGSWLGTLSRSDAVCWTADRHRLKPAAHAGQTQDGESEPEATLIDMLSGAQGSGEPIEHIPVAGHMTNGQNNPDANDLAVTGATTSGATGDTDDDDVDW